MLSRMLAIVAFGAGCATAHPYTWVSDLPPAAPGQSLQPKDAVTVQVEGQANLTGDFLVRSDGTVLLPVVGRLPAEGKSPDELAALLVERLDGIVINPKVTVSISETRELSVSVIGEVGTPGAYVVSGADNLLAVLARAGGITEFARRDAIYVVREGLGRRVRFDYDDLVGGEEESLAFGLRDGDTVVVE